MKKSLLKKVAAVVLAASMLAGMSTAAMAEETPDVSGVELNFWSDAVGSGTYNMIVEMSKVLENNGFGTVNVDPSYPGGMGAPYIF